MTTLKEKKRIGKKNLREARNILSYMENLLNTGNDEGVNMATAFFRMLNYHLEEGDLLASNVHLAALLREGL